MIYQIIDLPPKIVGFKASWEVTKRDFDEVVIPCVQKHVEKMGQSNYMLVLNSSIHNYTFCSWLKDALLTLRNITKWKRAAIVSDSKVLKFFAELISVFFPNELKGFAHNEMQEAIDWLAETEQQAIRA